MILVIHRRCAYPIVWKNGKHHSCSCISYFRSYFYPYNKIESSDHSPAQQRRAKKSNNHLYPDSKISHPTAALQQLSVSPCHTHNQNDLASKVPFFSPHWTWITLGKLTTTSTTAEVGAADSGPGISTAWLRSSICTLSYPANRGCA